MEGNPALLVVGVSVGAFKLINGAAGLLPMPEPALRNTWKWRNICTSLVHSVVTAAWALLCFYLHPRMAQDLIGTYSTSSHCLVSVSIGDHLFRHVRVPLPLRGLRRGGPAGGGQLHLPPPEADASDGQHAPSHRLHPQQHRQPGHLRGLPHQHAGLDDPLAGAEPRQRPARHLQHRQRRHGHHDPDEHRALLPTAQERLPQIQQGREEGEREVNLSPPSAPSHGTVTRIHQQGNGYQRRDKMPE
ncbi:TLC domain-containing protein 2 isoform X1 [Rhinoraja longicauda]